MDKNIAAFLDESAYTVLVQFQGTKTKEYTYVTNMAGLKAGDLVVVPIRVSDIHSRLLISGDALLSDHQPELDFQTKVGRVTKVDDEVEIEPNSDIEYSWVIDKVDLDNYIATLERNKKLMSVTANAYKKRMRKSFATQILGEMGDDEKAQVAQLLNRS
jgi:hypothetical protein